MGRVIDRRAEAIVLQEIARQQNLVEWYKGINKEMTDNAKIKIEELEQQLIKIREN